LLKGCSCDRSGGEFPCDDSGVGSCAFERGVTFSPCLRVAAETLVFDDASSTSVYDRFLSTVCGVAGSMFSPLPKRDIATIVVYVFAGKLSSGIRFVVACEGNAKPDSVGWAKVSKASMPRCWRCAESAEALVAALKEVQSRRVERICDHDSVIGDKSVCKISGTIAESAEWVLEALLGPISNTEFKYTCPANAGLSAVSVNGSGNLGVWLRVVTPPRHQLPPLRRSILSTKTPPSIRYLASIATTALSCGSQP